RARIEAERIAGQLTEATADAQALRWFESEKLDEMTIKAPRAVDDMIAKIEAVPVVDCTDPSTLTRNRPTLPEGKLPQIPSPICTQAELDALHAQAQAALHASLLRLQAWESYAYYIGVERSIAAKAKSADLDLLTAEAAKAEEAVASARKAVDAARKLSVELGRRKPDDCPKETTNPLPPPPAEPDKPKDETAGGGAAPPNDGPASPVPPRPGLSEPDPGPDPKMCTEEERRAWLKKIDEAIEKANADIRTANAHIQQLGALHGAAVGNYDKQLAFSLEIAEYNKVTLATHARAKALGERWGAVLNKPLDACEPPADGGSEPKKACPPLGKRQVRLPIEVGSRGKVGSGAYAKKKAISTIGGLLGGVLPGGGGGGGGKGGPPVADCRIKDSEKTVFTDPATGISLRVGAKQVGDTLAVFADVLKSPDSGTFQGGWIEQPGGDLLAPRRADICELYGEWTLTVSWTQTTYTDGVMTSQSSGGYQQSGVFSLPGMVSTDQAPAGLWKQLGFSNASHGAREVALQYPLRAGELAREPRHLLLHVTRPGQDTVTTAPFDLVLTQGDKGIAITGGPAVAPAEEDCPEPPATM
ncbi:MAG: hypothetical protein ACREBO_05220, partial [Novosphingobium sp.]